jgi:hypothetical protein
MPSVTLTDEEYAVLMRILQRMQETSAMQAEGRPLTIRERRALRDRENGKKNPST